jgi:hypothetical protein
MLVKRLLVPATVLLLAAACATARGPDGPQRIVFEVAGGFSQAGTNRIGTIVNLGLAPLNNISDATVRLRSVRLVSQPRAIRIVSISACLYSQAGPSPSLAGGNLPKSVASGVSAALRAPGIDPGLARQRNRLGLRPPSMRSISA